MVLLEAGSLFEVDNFSLGRLAALSAVLSRTAGSTNDSQLAVFAQDVQEACSMVLRSSVVHCINSGNIDSAKKAFDRLYTFMDAVSEGLLPKQVCVLQIE